MEMLWMTLLFMLAWWGGWLTRAVCFPENKSKDTGGDDR